MMDALQREAAKAALEKMFSGGHFSICVIDNILRMSGGVPRQHDYDILRTLHCVDFKAMSPQLRIVLPRLIQVVVESEPMQLPKVIYLEKVETSGSTMRLPGTSNER